MNRRRLLAIALLLMLWSIPAVAQTAPHLYVVPAVAQGSGRTPKYLNNFFAQDYGFQPVYLAVSSVDIATDTLISAQADVIRIPDNLDTPMLGGSLAIVQGALEDRNIPSGWITLGMTYRQVLRTVHGFFVFLQRYAVVSNTTELVIGGNVTLNTQFNQLPQSVRSNLQATAISLGLSTTGITGSSTIREILKNIADQWGQRVVILGPITI